MVSDTPFPSPALNVADLDEVLLAGDAVLRSAVARLLEREAGVGQSVGVIELAHRHGDRTATGDVELLGVRRVLRKVDRDQREAEVIALRDEGTKLPLDGRSGGERHAVLHGADVHRNGTACDKRRGRRGGAAGRSHQQDDEQR